ncbi:preprotein translocase subunit SecG [Rhodoplanes sp. Z2-YC6860]|uniref:preprotein translocase subunit SecG n=1 Tax=Rhodoplanes sp. Z2-YC6860 TaxID=674703 RepID=UPI00078C0078|nr:preprotein translocase subunit SecG [Rhodoplanes sp. Z2-YC6860]AMN42367.1 preprotein translocase subunit SecG [Rhodoplanes sp. Z2-YC6860]
MHYVIMLIHLMIVVAMVGLVLIQKSEGGGLGMGGGGGGGGGFLSSRGTANVLTRTTAILAAMFFVTSLFLSWYASLDRKPRSILDSSGPAAPSAPAVPGAPGAGGGVLNQLGGGTPQQQPAAPPQAPAGPQVPRQ